MRKSLKKFNKKFWSIEIYNQISYNIMQEKFNKIINENIKPYLKLNGFVKKGTNFYKSNNDLMFVINFQKSQGNTSHQTKFYINCGIHSNLINKVIGENETTHPKEYECHFRCRISSIIQSQTEYYYITEETNIENLSNIITSDLNSAIHMFDEIQSINDLTDLMIDKNGLENYRELFEFLLLSNNKKDLKKFIQQLYNSFGNEKRWIIFERNLNEILLENNIQKTINDILNIK